MAADQLQRAVERGEYAEAARLLEAVQQLAAHFASFGSVPKVPSCNCIHSAQHHLTVSWVNATRASVHSCKKGMGVSTEAHNQMLKGI